MIYKSKYGGYGEVDLINTGHDYDFIAYLENKTDKEMALYIDDLEGWYIDPYIIQSNDWMGFSADDEGRDIVEAIKNGDFRVKYIDKMNV